MVRPLTARGLLRRVNIYLAPKQISTLRKMAKAEGVAWAELIRRAIDALIEKSQETR